LPGEYNLIRENQIVFGFLHLAPAPGLTNALINRRGIGVAYETIQLPNGSLPLLAPMSQVAGRMAPQVGAHYLEKASGGRGVLLGGVPGVKRGKVSIIGGGVAGTNAARIALGLGAEVHILDINPKRLADLDEIFGGAISTEMSNEENIAQHVARSDLVIGAVLIPGARAPSVVSREMVSTMAPGAVIVDVCIDQGGCLETSRPTTHSDPVFLVDGVIHYCVTNIPALVSRTSTLALTNVTLPYVLEIADKGLARAVKDNGALARGVNVYKGAITCPGVADAMECSNQDILRIMD